MDNINRSRVEELKIRTKNCCCRYCGGELILKRIIYGDIKDGRVEIFCSECNRIEYGTNKEIYTIAKYFVDEFNFNIFNENDNSVSTYRLNVAKVCDIITWGAHNLGFLNFKGFVFPVNINNDILGEDIVLYDMDLDSMDEKEIIDYEV